MADPLANVSDLAERLDFTMDAQELSMATAAIEDLSDDARFYGSETWVSEAKTPRQVRNLVLRAAKRYMDNPNGYNTSRAGDETVGWSDKAPQVASGGTPEFTKKEIEVLKTLSGNARSGFYSVPVTGYGDPDRRMRTAPYTVPDPDGGKPFPLYNGPGPW